MEKAEILTTSTKDFPSTHKQYCNCPPETGKATEGKMGGYLNNYSQLINSCPLWECIFEHNIIGLLSCTIEQVLRSWLGVDWKGSDYLYPMLTTSRRARWGTAFPPSGNGNFQSWKPNVQNPRAAWSLNTGISFCNTLLY